MLLIVVSLPTLNLPVLLFRLWANFSSSFGLPQRSAASMQWSLEDLDKVVWPEDPNCGIPVVSYILNIGISPLDKTIIVKGKNLNL